MAETVHLFLKANKSDIQGDSTQTSLGREGSIECIFFEDSVRTARDKSTGEATGRRSYEPIRILKRIDRSSPLLAKALCNNEAVDGEFKFFRPNPAGDGTTEHFFTIEILNGRINDIVRTSPNCIDPASSTAPPLEEVSFVFETIRWIFVPTGAEHEDTWSDNA
ncbi:MAG: type VI secretion system tube protein Hcp [Myxococcales bacterium]|nr:type VI secretion system tube protein Hcp [Myxococcales bacterium]